MNASKITAVDFFDDLTSPYARKRFFWGFSLLSAACIGLIWAAESNLPQGILRTVSVSVLTELVGTFLTILFFYSLYVFFIGPNGAARAVSVTRPQDISDRMTQMPKGVRHYLFWGRSGSYFRSVPLLVLDAEARENKRKIAIEVLLPDPDDKRLVDSYRAMRKALDEDEGSNPLLPNVIATCMACAVVSANNNHLEITVHLSRYLPAFRVDLSDHGAILTQDDPKKSALFFEAGSEFFDMFQTMAKNESDVSRKISWDKALFVDRSLDAGSCDAETVKAFGIEVDNVEVVQREVARLISERPHRYK